MKLLKLNHRNNFSNNSQLLLLLFFYIFYLIIIITIIIKYIHIATQTHCYNPVAPAYPIWAYYAHGRQCRCQQDPVNLPSGRLEKTTRSSPHHVAQHRPTGSETTPPYAPRSSRFGSEPPSVEDDVEVWRYAILSCMPETTTMTIVGQVGWTLCRHGLTRDSANVVILFTVSILFASFAEIFVQIS